MRVLVVEDVRRLADDIAEGLRDEAMAVDIAYDGLEATAKLSLNRYDVVILDRDLPGLHGDTICQMITEGTNPAVVLMLTAADAPHDRVAGLRLGADDYLPKPFNFDELVLRVYGLARRRPTAAPPPIDGDHAVGNESGAHRPRQGSAHGARGASRTDEQLHEPLVNATPDTAPKVEG